jgi:hypothetical protein
MNARALLFLLGTSLTLVGCDEPVSCVPAEISQSNALRSEQALATRFAQGGTDQIDAKNPQIHLYLDVSYSLRGFLTGATCANCVSPNAKAAPEGPEFNDTLFRSIVLNMTNLPLQVLGGATPVKYNVFAEKIAESHQDLFQQIAQNDRCYDQNDPAKRKNVEARTYKVFKEKEKCIFEGNDKDRKSALSQVGNRSISPLKAVFEDIKTRLENRDSPIDEGLFIVASDLFISNSRDVVGANAPLVAPLAELVKKGFQIRLFGFKVPFSGMVDDVPTQSFQVRGLVPFYYIAVGTPRAMDRFSLKVMEASRDIQYKPSVEEPKRTLAGSDRFQSFGIGGKSVAFTPSFVTDFDFPATDGAAAPAIVSTEIDYDRALTSSGDLLASGAPVTVRWLRPKDSTRPAPIKPSDYRTEVLAWRWTGQATSGDRCPVSWEQVPVGSLNPGALTAADSNTLEMTIFQGGDGFNVLSGTPYVLQFDLKPAGTSGVGWVNTWSSDVNSIDDDREAAKEPGAFLRTYNLSTLFKSVAASAMAANSAPVLAPPLASSTLSVRFN